MRIRVEIDLEEGEVDRVTALIDSLTRLCNSANGSATQPAVRVGKHEQEAVQASSVVTNGLQLEKTDGAASSAPDGSPSVGAAPLRESDSLNVTTAAPQPLHLPEPAVIYTPESLAGQAQSDAVPIQVQAFPNHFAVQQMQSRPSEASLGASSQPGTEVPTPQSQPIVNHGVPQENMQSPAGLPPRTSPTVASSSTVPVVPNSAPLAVEPNSQPAKELVQVAAEPQNNGIVGADASSMADGVSAGVPTTAAGFIRQDTGLYSAPPPPQEQLNVKPLVQPWIEMRNELIEAGLETKSIDDVAASIRTVLATRPDASEDDLSNAFMYVLFDDDAMNLRLANQKTILPVVDVLCMMEREFQKRAKDQALQTSLAQLNVGRPVDCNRLDFYAFVECFAAFCMFNIVPLSAALKSIVSLLRQPSKRTAGVTMLGKTVELCLESLLNQVDPRQLEELRLVILNLEEPEFQYDLEYIMSNFGWQR
eukprot:CAMPEP_0185849028 /NCGR_PEP_ID=MMETSP1354-20130828/3689_1 /TAXON_ID=708628 /ORGANISM="Erythrolobus madagascarensis, Strain CCMP3276" /LENGTH=477 /DNA_ID=CAMNT_0028549507 /DNA_START=139 /DNA_END=1572 /DNA_ORIENTATION=+